MLKWLQRFISSPMLIALFLGGFSTYLVNRGQMEAAMSAAGAAATVATIKRDDSDENSEERLENALMIQEIRLTAHFQKEMHDNDMKVMHEKLSLQEQEIANKDYLLLEMKKELDNIKVSFLLND